MAKVKYDGVIEAVRYNPNGQINWVRMYSRRGPIFSDRVLVERQALVEQLKAGKNIMVGRRLEHLAGTFEVNKPVRLREKDGKEVITTGDGQGNRDSLENAPIL